MQKIFILTFLFFISTSCFKTAEQVRREKLLDNMGSQIDQSGQLVAKLTQQMNELESKMSSFNGQIEELSHAQKMTLDERLNSMTLSLKSLDEQVKALRAESDSQKSQILSLEKELNASKEYVKKVNAALASGVTSKTSSAPTTLSSAHQAFEKGNSKEAEKLYLQILDENKISAKDKNHVYYNLGYLYYNQKNYDNSLVYHSKIYANYPKSSWAPRALLYMARSLKNLGKTKEAKGAYEELIKNFPNTPQAKSAAEEK